MPDISLEIEGLEEYESKLLDTQLLGGPLAGVMDEASQVGQAAAVEGVDGGTGVAVRSIFRDAQPMMARVGTHMADARALSIERGRPVGDAPHPVQVERWLQGSVRIRTASSEAFRLAAAIRQRGTRGRFFISAARQKVQEALPRLVEDAAERVRARWERDQ